MLPAQNPRTPCLACIYTVRKTAKSGGRVVNPILILWTTPTNQKITPYCSMQSVIYQICIFLDMY
ncbi:MAG: hypothetical protein ACI4M5_00620 [Christensenellales bacterium]